MKADIRKSLQKSPLEVIGKFVEEESDSRVIDSLNRLGEELDATIKIRNNLINDQKLTSKSIGAAKKNDLDSSVLLSEMSSISANLDNTRAKINSLLDEIETFLPVTDKRDNTSAELSKPSGHPAHFYPDHTLPDADQPTLTIDFNCSRDKWDDYVNNHPQATIYHESGWRELIKSNFGHKSYYLAALDSNGNVRGILPLINLRSVLFGNFLISMPYFNYGGPIADNAAICSFLLRQSSLLADDLGCTHTEIREHQPRENWPVRTDKVSMVLALPKDKQTLSKQLGAKIRAEIKRPLQYNASITFGTTELLDAFYRVFSRKMRELGTPVYSKHFFKSILEFYTSNAFIAVVTVDNEPVAAGFLLGYRDTLEIPWAASIKHDIYPSINMFLYGNLVEEAINKGFEFFDFGRSTVDGPTYRFKKQWGAVPQPLFWHYWLKSGGELPSLNPDNPKYRLAINTWKRLPLWITRAIGPFIVRNLP